MRHTSLSTSWPMTMLMESVAYCVTGITFSISLVLLCSITHNFLRYSCSQPSGLHDNSGAAGDWVNCGTCGEWAHFGCDRRQGLGAFKVL